MDDQNINAPVTVEIDSQDLALERGFYAETLKDLDKYYDLFNNPNTRKKTILTILVSALIIIFATVDIVSNGFLIAYFYYLDDGGGEFLVTFYSVWLGLSHYLQTSYFIKTDLYSSRSEDHSRVRFILLFFTTWFMLPYIRLYDTLRNNDILLDHMSWGELNYINHNIYSWIRNISTKFELFLYRGLIESGGSCCFLIFCIYGDLSIINNGPKLEDNGLFLFDTLHGNVNIVFISLLIKVCNFLLCVFIFFINGSHSFEVYTHLADCLTFLTDLARQFVTLVIVLYSITLYFFYDDDYSGSKGYIDNTDDYLILLQLYFYPSLYLIIYLAIYFVRIVWIHSYRGCVTNNNGGALHICLFYLMFVFILAPICFGIGVCGLQLVTMITFDVAYLSLVCDAVFQTIFTRHNASVLNYKDAKDKDYKAYYNLMNKICYFLLEDVSFNRLHLNVPTTEKKNRKEKTCCKCVYIDTSFYQQVGVINYEILQACVATKQFKQLYKQAMDRHLKKQQLQEKKKKEDNVQFKLADSNSDQESKENENMDDEKQQSNVTVNNDNNDNNNDSSDVDDEDDENGLGLHHLNLSVKFLDQLKEAEKNDLMCSVDDSYFFTKIDLNHGHSTYYFKNLLKYIYVGLYEGFWGFLFDPVQPGDNVLKIENSPKRVMFHLLIIVFIISRINLMVYPFYFLIFINYKQYNEYNKGISNFEFFIEILIFVTIGLYLYMFWVWFKYIIPLYHKLCYILPWDRLTDKNGRGYQLLTLFELFKGADVKVGDQIMEQILMHYTALKIRPIKEKIVMQCLKEELGNDISRIVVDYLPIREYLHNLGSLQSVVL